jgi:uncharacterized protein YggE
MPVTINVKGHSSVRVPADRVTLRITITKDSKSKEESVKTVTESVARVQALLRRLSSADASNSSPACVEFNTQSLSTTSQKPYYDRETMEEEPEEDYSTSVWLMATFGDFKALAKLNAELFMMREVQISSVDWKLSNEVNTKHQTLVRTEAIHDAKAQAQDYARALGCGGFLRAVEVAGDGARLGTDALEVAQAASYRHRTVAYNQAADMPHMASIDLDPPKIEITCNIQVRWEAEV